MTGALEVAEIGWSRDYQESNTIDDSLISHESLALVRGDNKRAHVMSSGMRWTWPLREP